MRVEDGAAGTGWLEEGALVAMRTGPPTTTLDDVGTDPLADLEDTGDEAGVDAVSSTAAVVVTGAGVSLPAPPVAPSPAMKVGPENAGSVPTVPMLHVSFFRQPVVSSTLTECFRR